jgi:hypothetical protein
MSASCTVIACLFALFYPNVGTVLSYFGAVSGLLIIYCLPVFVHLKYKETALLNPMLAEAIQKNQFDMSKSAGNATPQITVNDELLTKRKDLMRTKKGNSDAMCRFRVYYWLHMLIPVYGLATVFFQFFKI